MYFEISEVLFVPFQVTVKTLMFLVQENQEKDLEEKTVNVTAKGIQGIQGIPSKNAMLVTIVKTLVRVYLVSSLFDGHVETT